jgi:uroporphyrin-III C-methyltransferase
MQSYPTPEPGASLLLSLRLQNKSVLVVGSGALAASRVFASLEANASVIVIAKGGLSSACDELKWRAHQNQISFVDWDDYGIDDDAVALDEFLSTTLRISLAIVTDTTAFSQRRSYASAKSLYQVFQSHSIPVNIPDMPDLCDFSFASSHRFTHHESGEKTSLQIGVITNGHGCRLASRLRREIVTKLPRELGAATQNIGEMRSLAISNCGDDDEKGVNIISEEGDISIYIYDIPFINLF